MKEYRERKPISDKSIDTSSGKELGRQLQDLAPGDVIEFADITELIAFEDVIAKVVDSKHNPDRWISRPNLRDLIRPPKFNGTIANIHLTVMADPYERLLDAPERGWKNAEGRGRRTGKTNELTANYADSLKQKYRGFILTADAKSSGRGTIGQIQAEMWYFPATPLIRKAGVSYRNRHKLKSGEVREYTGITQKESSTRGGSRYGDDIRRIVTFPRIEPERFLAHDERSRTIGFKVLREAMARPISTPMRD